MTSSRLRAAALLDVLRYRQDGDCTAEHRRRAERYRRPPAGLPELAWAWAWADNLEHGPPTSALSIARAWWPATRPRPALTTLVLAGSYGVGKSLAAAWLLAHHPALAHAAYERAPELGELELGSPDALARLAATRALVLEELGREAAIGPTIERLAELLALRLEKGRPTLVTTNLRLEQLRERYGAHIVDRLRGDGSFRALVEPSKRTPDRRPQLDSITRSCTIADLVAQVDAATAAGSADATAIDLLLALVDVPEAELAAKLAERARWQAEARG